MVKLLGHINKLFIIGNGFDLAHGLRTQYSDFIAYLWENEKEKVFSDNCYFPIYNQVGNIVHAQTGTLFEGDLVSFICQNRFSKSMNSQDYNLQNFEFFKKYIFTENANSDVKMTIKNSFLEKITKINYIDNHLCNWVDIENEYYKELKKCLKIINDDTFCDNDCIKRLNEEFKQIRDWLEIYLLDQLNKPDEHNRQVFNKLCKILLPELYQDEKSIVDKFNQPINIDDIILFLNFNYTDTEKYYFEYFNNHLTGNKVHNIHIHGEIGNYKNPIIFGYGDEMDKGYLEIEGMNNKPLLENIKSMKYLQTPNYRNLLLFLESYDFEVFILGHSCGLSDRTLLNTIFEHNNCKRIKIFYFQRPDGTDDFDDKIMNIYRNFKEKQCVRAKVIDKTNCEPLIDLTKETANASNN